jgi:hypothetical protein
MEMPIGADENNARFSIDRNFVVDQLEMRLVRYFGESVGVSIYTWVRSFSREFFQALTSGNLEEASSLPFLPPIPSGMSYVSLSSGCYDGRDHHIMRFIPRGDQFGESAAALSPSFRKSRLVWIDFASIVVVVQSRSLSNLRTISLSWFAEEQVMKAVVQSVSILKCDRKGPELDRAEQGVNILPAYQLKSFMLKRDGFTWAVDHLLIKAHMFVVFCDESRERAGSLSRRQFVKRELALCCFLPIIVHMLSGSRLTWMAARFMLLFSLLSRSRCPAGHGSCLCALFSLIAVIDGELSYRFTQSVFGRLLSLIGSFHLAAEMVLNVIIELVDSGERCGFHLRSNEEHAWSVCCRLRLCLSSGIGGSLVATAFGSASDRSIS